MKKESVKKRSYGRRNSRKLIAILMALTMALVALPIIAAAKDAGTEKTHVNQVVYDGGLKDASNIRYYDVDGREVQESDSWVVSTSKTLVPAATNIENEFDITLAVTTKTEVKEEDVSTDVAAVLVIDISYSMDSNSIDGQKRIELAKSAAKTFVANYAAGADLTLNEKRLLSVVAFGQHAYLVSGWTDVAVAANKSSIDSEIDSLKYGYGSPADQGFTFLQGGLKYAQNLLEISPASGIIPQNRFVVLLTDGNPTAVQTNTSTANYSTVTGRLDASGRGDNGNWNTNTSVTSADYVESQANIRASRTPAVTAANAIKDSGDSGLARIYAVGFALDQSLVVDSKNGDKWLSENIASGGDSYTIPTDNPYYFVANNLGDLNVAFTQINTQIRLRAHAWTVTDPMGQMIGDSTGEGIIFKEFLTTNNNFRWFSNNTITWQLYLDTTRVQSGSDDSAEYIYTLSYRVILDTVARGTRETLTNGPTYLNYFIRNGNTFSSVYKADFYIPIVKGYAGKLEFTKVSSNGEALGGFTFEIRSADDRYVDTATSGSDGSVNFYGIPSGPQHSYTVTEIGNPMASLYNNGQPFAVKVAYGAAEHSLADNRFVNPARSVPIIINKSFFSGDEELLTDFIEYSYVKALVCENEDEEHVHDLSCYDNVLMEDWDYEYEFIFDLYNNRGNVVNTATLTSLKSDIYAMMTEGTSAQLIVTVPATEIGNGPFAIKERGKENYTGWTLVEELGGIYLVPDESTIVDLENQFGAINRPWFMVSKVVTNPYDGVVSSDETFTFRLYDGGTLIDEFTIVGNGSKTIRLDRYINESATLRLVEVAGYTAGMAYDPMEYAIEIVNGKVTAINNMEGAQTVTFNNVYHEPVYPWFEIVKSTNGEGRFTFEYVIDGYAWDGIDIENSGKTVYIENAAYNAYINDSGSVTVDLEELGLANFSGSIKIREIPGGGSGDGEWAYDETEYALQFVDGKFTGKAVNGAEVEADGTVSFVNGYTPPEIPVEIPEDKDPTDNNNYTPPAPIYPPQPEPQPGDAEEPAEIIEDEEPPLTDIPDMEIPLVETTPDIEEVLDTEEVSDTEPVMDIINPDVPLGELPRTGLGWQAFQFVAFGLGLAAIGTGVMLSKKQKAKK